MNGILTLVHQRALKVILMSLRLILKVINFLSKMSKFNSLQENSITNTLYFNFGFSQCIYVHVIYYLIQFKDSVG